jgi:hypothetical protein
MWICHAHPGVWYAPRALARHSTHHTEHHRCALLGCGLFQIDIAAPWGIIYVSSWPLTYLIDHPEHWHRVCNKIAIGGASHCNEPVTVLCTLSSEVGFKSFWLVFRSKEGNIKWLQRILSSTLRSENWIFLLLPFRIWWGAAFASPCMWRCINIRRWDHARGCSQRLFSRARK